MALRERYRQTIGRRLRGRRATQRGQGFGPTLEQGSLPKKKTAGIIRPDTGALRLPSGFEELGEQRAPESSTNVVWVIVVLMLIFISIITYFVAQMPDKP